MKLREIKSITGVIVLKTGLHIGAGSDEIHIGGIDSPVVKDPLTGWPYIPGSSLKGKIRTLLEWATGKIDKENGRPWATTEGNDPIARIFGNGSLQGEYKNYDGGPTRASFSDCFMVDSKAQEMIEKGVLTEEKIEVSINRIKGTAISPRRMERVPAGAVFNFEITYRVYDMGDGGEEDEKNFKLLLKGLKLLEYDALGGSGSRGYGRIKFEDVKVNGKDCDFENIDISSKAFEEFAKK